MTGGERRLKKALRKASGREKGLLIVNNNAAVLLGKERLLTVSEERDIYADVQQGLEGQGFVNVLSGGAALNPLVFVIKDEFNEAIAALLHVSDIFTSILQYRCFGNLLNDLCGGTSKRSRALQERCLEYARWYPFLGTFTLADVEYGFLSFELSEEYVESALKVIEGAVKTITSVKTSIQAARDFMEEYTLSIAPYEALLTRFESESREGIRLTKQLLFPALEGAPKLEELPLNENDPLRRIKEALPEYDALAIDEERYAEIYTSLEHHWPRNYSST